MFLIWQYLEKLGIELLCSMIHYRSKVLSDQFRGWPLRSNLFKFTSRSICHGFWAIGSNINHSKWIVLVIVISIHYRFWAASNKADHSKEIVLVNVICRYYSFWAIGSKTDHSMKIDLGNINSIGFRYWATYTKTGHCKIIIVNRAKLSNLSLNN